MVLIEEVTLIALFIVALCLPVLGMAFRIELSPVQQEKRALAPFPPVALKRHVLGAFPEKFKLYFDDHFGFRNTLIRWQAIAKVKWLGVSSSDKVIVGKDGWLFYASESSLKSYMRTEPFSQEQLAHWQQILEARRAWLAERGIGYLFVIAPDKHTIYPEYMPDNISRHRRESRLDQLIAYLKQHSDIRILDLRPALFEAKTRRRIYYLTDSHWNDSGAFVAYRSIIEELSKSFPQVKPLPDAALEVTRQQTPGIGLAAMLGLEDIIREDDLWLRLRPEVSVQIQGTNGDYKPLFSEQKDSGLPRLVMFRDSFASALIPFMAPHFSRAVYIWNKGLDPRLIEAERPNVVIHEMVERFLMLDPPQRPLETVQP
ncbi:MAG TPA: hypothetical protein VGX92_20675 [Pyrinomonadaceae bacterium]|nr:hypothetical protein [Pyrinomonadaceae bacterium]